MKKFLNSIPARALSTLALGIILIVFSEQITKWLVILSGVFFVIPGIVTLISYFRRDPESQQVMLYPVLGAGSILFGIVLIAWPTLFLEFIVYILTALLVVTASSQFYRLWNIKKAGVAVHPLSYLIPTLELLAALYIVVGNNAEKVAGLPVILLGCGFIVYSLLELWTLVLIRRIPKPDTDKPWEQDAEIIEEIKD